MDQPIGVVSCHCHAGLVGNGTVCIGSLWQTLTSLPKPQAFYQVIVHWKLVANPDITSKTTGILSGNSGIYHIFVPITAQAPVCSHTCIFLHKILYLTVFEHNTLLSACQVIFPTVSLNNSRYNSIIQGYRGEIGEISIKWWKFTIECSFWWLLVLLVGEGNRSCYHELFSWAHTKDNL